MKKRTKLILVSLFMILLILNLTIPSEADYYNWLREEYNIKESDKLYYYTQGDIELFSRSTHQRAFGFLITREENFEYTDGDVFLGNGSSIRAFGELNPDEGFTIRSLWISKMIFDLDEESILWRILM